MDASAITQVNRTFYKIFMSDRVWERLNIYNVEKHIAGYYLAKAGVFTDEELKHISSIRHTESTCRLDWHSSNHLCLFDKYSWNPEPYLVYTPCANHLDDSVSGNNFNFSVNNDRVRRALIRGFGLLVLGNNKEQADADLVGSAMLAKPRAYVHASAEIKAMPDTRLALNHCPGNFQLMSDAFREILEIACLAIKLDPPNYRLIPPDGHTNEAIYRAQVRNLRGRIDHLKLK